MRQYRKTLMLQSIPSLPIPPGIRGAFYIFESGSTMKQQLKWGNAPQWLTEKVHFLVNKIHRCIKCPTCAGGRGGRGTGSELTDTLSVIFRKSRELVDKISIPSYFVTDTIREPLYTILVD